MWFAVGLFKSGCELVAGEKAGFLAAAGGPVRRVLNFSGLLAAVGGDDTHIARGVSSKTRIWKLVQPDILHVFIQSTARFLCGGTEGGHGGTGDGREKEERGKEKKKQN